MPGLARNHPQRVVHLRRLQNISIQMSEIDKPLSASENEPRPELRPGLVESLTSAYAMLLKTQRTASTAYVIWNKGHKRSHEFAWLETSRETILMDRSGLTIKPESPMHPAVQKMMATMELNPYERELLYGFPYIIGQSGGIKFRAPLLTIPISITANGGNLIINPSEDAPRFNTLPFRTESDTSARELAFARLMEQCPDLPLTSSSLKCFCEAVARELGVVIGGRLDGTLHGAPTEPKRQTPLTIVDHAACFIAPKTSYFLVSDLDVIGQSEVWTIRPAARKREMFK